MTVWSKFFQSHVQSETCQSLSFHTDSCLEHCLKDLFLHTAYNLRYLAPICFLPALLKIHRMNRKELRSTLEYYAELSMMVTAISWTSDILLCLFRKLLGYFSIYTMIFWPSVIGGCMINLGSPRAKELFFTTLFQCSIESFFQMRQHFISRVVANSRFLQTWIFMLCSAIIIQGKHLYNIKGFWLLQPNPKLAEIENRQFYECQLHPKVNCQRFLLEGMRKYFLLGLSLDILKILMNKVQVDATEKRSIILGKLKNFRLRSTALLTAHIGIYRFSNCLLNRHFPNGPLLNHIASAFLAGSCYIVYPQSTLFSYGLLQAIRTVWSIIQIENGNTKNTAVRFLLRLPFGKILFPLAVASCTQLICLKPEYASPLATTIINSISNNYPKHLNNQLSKFKEKVNAEKF